MIRYITLLLLLILSNAVAPAADASVCRNYRGEQICILSINRSAKNHWEYRTVISVNGAKRPLEVYNCREQFRVQQDGNIVKFTEDGTGKLICSFFPKL